jgi:hypothetical protein
MSNCDKNRQREKVGERDRDCETEKEEKEIIRERRPGET